MAQTETEAGSSSAQEAVRYRVWCCAGRTSGDGERLATPQPTWSEPALPRASHSRQRSRGSKIEYRHERLATAENEQP